MTKRFLTVCEGGNCRSVALARVLKIEHNQFAIAIGWRYADSAMWKMLGEWADYIVLMESSFIDHVPREYVDKARALDVGPDTFGVPTHPMLYGACVHWASIWAQRNFAL